MSILLDTNILIDHLRGDDRATSFLNELAAMPSASVVTLTELLAGSRSQREDRNIETLSQSVHFLPVDEAIARHAGQFAKHYHPSHGLDDLDALIAATAEHHGLKLATLNVKHFPMLKGLKKAY
jgi:predicted nucleic acid-binding protein